MMMRVLAAVYWLWLLQCCTAYNNNNNNKVNNNNNNNRYYVVDEKGAGNFASIQKAVDAVPSNNNQPFVIQINAGIFRERVVVPASKRFITFQGAGRGLTIIEGNLKASDIGSDGKPLTAYNTATVTVLASNFIARDITFKNTQPPPPAGVDGFQASAFRVSGDMASFYRCGFVGGQDTLCDDQGRHYFQDCFIQGSIDFIFGNARSLYKRCEMRSIARDFGSIAAQDRQYSSENTGFVFLNCTITGTGPVYLGRAMGPYSRIIYAYSHIEGIVDPRGWDDWDHDSSKDGTVYFGQYRCSGAGADSSHHVPWSHELTQEQAMPYLDSNFVDGTNWLQG